MKIIKLWMEDKLHTYTVSRRGHVQFCRGHEINNIFMLTIETCDYMKYIKHFYSSHSLVNPLTDRVFLFNIFVFYYYYYYYITVI